MEPGLSSGDVVAVSPAPARLKRGMVVVFRAPSGWGSTPGEHIDRVIGVAGDRIKCCDAHGNLVLNGKRLEEPYRAKGSRAAMSAFAVKVPEEHLWLMGDNRRMAFDSLAARLNSGGGFVATGRVTGVIGN